MSVCADIRNIALTGGTSMTKFFSVTVILTGVDTGGLSVVTDGCTIDSTVIF